MCRTIPQIFVQINGEYTKKGTTRSLHTTRPSDVHLEDWKHPWKHLWKAWKHNSLINSVGLEASNQIITIGSTKCTSLQQAIERPHCRYYLDPGILYNSITSYRTTNRNLELDFHINRSVLQKLYIFKSQAIPKDLPGTNIKCHLLFMTSIVQCCYLDQSLQSI
ncbi:hypothetical protein RclHR1_00030041 [Rhizophagus clarus]|uniref:Uncharacterized protein n=1 Tax=Rhizophagus clarus TaxID=94130 RepID=A0A2Z6RHD9_9GLOM|nr:hypothetical protein RclHR1_00030041 [Rhizophagus clarus]GES95548.1 hypothetical protein RCL_e13418_RclHR1_00030041 [Rhizophagus clarus]